VGQWHGIGVEVHDRTTAAAGYCREVAVAGKLWWWPMSWRRAFWLVGDRAGCHAVPCLKPAENMPENSGAKYICAGKWHVSGYL